MENGDAEIWAILEDRKPTCSSLQEGRDSSAFTGARDDSLADEPQHGVRAEVKVAGEHLRLVSEHSALGVQASVYNVNAKNWIAPSETMDDIDHGKDRAAAHGKAYLRRVANLELPPLNWKKSPSA